MKKKRNDNLNRLRNAEKQFVNEKDLEEIIHNKAGMKYCSLFGLDDLSQFDKGYIMALKEILNDIKYMEKIDL